MGRAATNGIELEYEFIGPEQGEVVLAITGVIETLHHWPSGLCWRLADSGYRTLRYDARDCGRSTWLEATGVPTGPDAIPPYTLDDLAQDAIGLLDKLGITRAHLVGFSAGGCVAQILAARHPERLSSLIVFNSTSRAPGLPGRSPDALQNGGAWAQAGGSHQEAVDRIIPTLDQSDGTVYWRAPEEKQLWVDLLVARGYNPAGVARYRLAMQKSPPHHDLLGRIQAPTTIIHATEDKSFALEHGEDLARRIPGARLRAIEGAGHGMPVSLTPHLAELFIDHLNWSKRHPGSTIEEFSSDAT